MPFHSQGSTVWFTTRYPTDSELKSCQHIILTSPTEWDPQADAFPGAKRSTLSHDFFNDEHRQAFINRVTINKSTNTARDAPTFESDMTLTNMNGALTEQLLTEWMTANINYSSTAYLLASFARHSSHPPNRLAKFLGWTLHVCSNSSKPLLKKVYTRLSTLFSGYTALIICNCMLMTLQGDGQWIISIPMSSSLEATLVLSLSPTVTLHGYSHEWRRMMNVLQPYWNTFLDDVGITVNLRTDMAPSFVGKYTGFQKLIGKYHIRLDHQEAERKNQIYKLDLEVCELCKSWHQLITIKNVPSRV